MSIMYEAESEEDGYSHYHIRLRDNDIGEIEDVTYRYPTGFDEDDITFYWTDGNGACDCNRMLEFYRQRGQPDIRRTCGDTRMTLLGIWRARDGVLVVPGEE
jgi:hypothetical protein